MKVDLTDPQRLADLLNAFFAYTEPAHEDFGKAIGEFKERVPDLARGLVEKIKEAHRSNPRFIEAFDAFYELCRNSLNPNLSVAAVDEMLVQHLLTERLIRTIFDNQDFTRRNVIAAEVEKVIDALVSKSFNRHDFLKSLDRFYLAIESAAATIESFAEKQHFLNTVYERFFQGYSVKVADTHGIVYTPQEIVDFMCASVEEVLQSEFGKTLGDPDVQILDPCTGTGNFIVNLLRRIPKRDLPRMYRQQLFANEVMLLPYYIAALNIEHAHYELTGEYEAFPGLCFVDTLDLAKGKQGTFGFMTQENVARVQREQAAPITVVIGNPPYNAWQLNENDNNKNRKYEIIDRRVSETYAKDSRATNKNALSDMYVKFFRWAVDRLNGRDGIVCFVSNNSFVEQIAFDGMRKHLLQDFTRVYHLHLEGNVRHNPKLAGTTYNVFGIQVGVGITVAVRASQHRGHRLLFHRVEKTLRREQKLAWLAEHGKLGGVKWQRLKPDARNTWLVPANGGEYSPVTAVGRQDAESLGRTGEAIFARFSGGVKTNRDDMVYGFDRADLRSASSALIEAYNGEVDRYKRSRQRQKVDDFVSLRQDQVEPRPQARPPARQVCRVFRSENSRLLVPAVLQRAAFSSTASSTKKSTRCRLVFPVPEAENATICGERHRIPRTDVQRIDVLLRHRHPLVRRPGCPPVLPLLRLRRGRHEPPRKHHRLGPEAFPRALRQQEDHASGTSSITSTACCTIRATASGTPTT